MRLLHGLLLEDGSFPSWRTFERRGSTLPGTLPERINRLPSTASGGAGTVVGEIGADCGRRQHRASGQGRSVVQAGSRSRRSAAGYAMSRSSTSRPSSSRTGRYPQEVGATAHASPSGRSSSISSRCAASPPRHGSGCQPWAQGVPSCGLRIMTDPQLTGIGYEAENSRAQLFSNLVKYYK